MEQNSRVTLVFVVRLYISIGLKHILFKTILRGLALIWNSELRNNVNRKGQWFYYIQEWHSVLEKMSKQRLVLF